MNLLSDRRGAVAVVFALSLISLVAATGLAVDVAQAYVVRTKLTQALDAAGLAVGSTMGTDQQLSDRFTAFFNANFPTPQMGTLQSVSFAIQGNIISTSASATVPMAFMGIMGISSMTVTASSQITREVTGLEVVLALDNTGSMADNGKIAALRDSATQLINILFGSLDHPDKLKVALVPFVTAVNIGSGNSAYVQGLNQSAFTPTTWKGCVVERAYPNDVRDTTVAQGGKWTPYLWPREAQNSNCARYSTTIKETPSTTSGPNKSCAQPIQPLTNDKTTLLNAIAAMQPWNNSGTMVHVGLAWAWRVISPDEPFTEGLPYNTPSWKKVVIVLTDGENNINIQPSQCRNAGGPYTEYTAQGYKTSVEMQTSLATLNSRTAEVCQNIKDAGILLYTITFQQNSTTLVNLFRQCASNPNMYFDSPSSADLQGVFTAIGNQLSNLRISH